MLKITVNSMIKMLSIYACLVDILEYNYLHEIVMFTFSKDLLFINDLPTFPIQIVFDYTPVEIAYFCFTSGYNLTSLTSIIIQQLAKFKVLPRMLIPRGLMSYNLCGVYHVNLQSNNLLKSLMLEYNCDIDDIILISSFGSIGLTSTLDAYPYYKAYLDPAHKLRNIINAAFDNSPYGTICLLYLQHKYIVLGLVIIYLKLYLIHRRSHTSCLELDDVSHQSNILTTIILDWFPIKNNLLTEAYQTINYLLNFDNITEKQIVSYFNKLNTMNSGDINNELILRQLYKYGKLSESEIDSFILNRYHIICQMQLNLATCVGI